MDRKLPIEAAQSRRSSGASIICCLLTALLLALLAIPIATAQSPTPADHDVKAAYLLNFGKFVRHPAPQVQRSAVDICVLGHDPITQSLDEVAVGETIDNLPIRIQRLPDITDAKTCTILYISASEGEHLREDLAIISGTDVLTVGEAPDFLERGGMIQFVVVDNRIRFAVNLNAVNRAHLVLSSELLRVAASITGKPPAGEQP
jgi:hypothetical protein